MRNRSGTRGGGGDVGDAAAVQVEDLREVRIELRRAHAAIHWFAGVRSAVTSGALVAQGTDWYGLYKILAVAHAVSEVWLSGDVVTARAVADLLGWHTENGELEVRKCLRPLQKCFPPMVLDDLRPNIEEYEIHPDANKFGLSKKVAMDLVAETMRKFGK